MARFVRFLALHILCVAFIPWPDTSAQIDWLSTGKSTNARSTTMMTSTSTASSMTFVPSHFLTPSIMTTISSIKPSNSSSIKPSNTSSIKPFNTSSIKPSNTSSIKPSNTSSIKPSNTSSIKPSNTSSIKPSNTSSIKPSNTSSIKPSNTSSIKPSNTSSTVTMTSIHNMTVTPHSTTTPSRTTVLPIHNTTVMPLHSTRIKPSSAHSVMPTSSVAPKPPAHQGNFSVKQNNSVCLIADMEAQFTISYKHKKKLENVTVTLPTKANASGMCRSKLSSIVLMWPPERNLYQFTLNFSQSSGIEQAKSGAWVMDHFTLVIFTTNNTQFPGAEGPNITFTSSKSLLNSTGKAYKCIHGSLQYNLKNGKTQSAKITIKNYEFQPFDVKHRTFSDDVQHCPADNPRTSPPTSTVSPTSTKNNSNKTVAIAVGCSLAGLVVIVLVGYLIGRRRSRSQAGYRKL